jgi:SAM-dependent methyltransferase
VTASGGAPPEAQAVGDCSFGPYYYAHCCGRPYSRTDEWLAIFGTVADAILRDIAPRRVLDAGCAIGLLVETLRARGVDAHGIDISGYAIANLHDAVKSYCRHGSIAAELDGRYDLITCIEVVEHMPPTEAEAAIANFCRHTDDVLFSSSPNDHREPTHVNVQPPEHWAEIFARHGFFRDVDFDASFVTPWAARYRRRSDPLHKIVRAYERRYWHLLAAAHDSRSYSAEQQQRIETLEAQLAETPLALAQALDRIRHMERSWFWKARRPWEKLAALVRRRS